MPGFGRIAESTATSQRPRRRRCGGRPRRLGERFVSDDIEAAAVEFQGEPICTATPRTLYRMNRDTVRTLDQADAAALRRTFDLEDE